MSVTGQEYRQPPPPNYRFARPPGGDDAAGFLLGIFLWALTLAYINPNNKNPASGVTGVRNYLRAKFLNKGSDGEYLE